MRTVLVLSIGLFVGCMAGGCGSSGSSGPSTSAASRPSPTAPPPTSEPPTTSTTPSAADDLLGYFAAAEESDRRLKAAAVAANGSIGAREITITQSTIDTIKAADPSQAADKIPAGLPPEVLLPVLTVQSDLVSRYYAFRGFLAADVGSIPRVVSTPGSMTPSDYLLTCLGNGGPAAYSFAADMTAARAAASRAPPVSPVDPSSQTAADLAIQLHVIDEQNSGCMSCGGFRITELPPITWHQVAALTPGGNPWDGDIGGLLFTAHFTSGEGWAIQTNAC
jgi:hypothetical protein